MPAASERMAISVVLTSRYPFVPGCSPVWATRWALQPALVTMQPSHGHFQRRAPAGTPTNKGHPPASPYSKNSATCRSSMGRPPRSSSLGCDQSAVSGAQDGGRESYTSTGCDQSTVLGVASVSESKLDSSKVTCLLGHMGLVEGTCLLAASPVWPSTGGICA